MSLFTNPAMALFISVAILGLVFFIGYKVTNSK